MRQSSDLLLSTLQKWSRLYEHPLDEEQMEEWTRIFRLEDPVVLERALEVVTRSAKSMPRPGHLHAALASAREQVTGINRSGLKRCECPDCGGSGYRVRPLPNVGGRYKEAVKCECHPAHWNGHA
jgi:hypothetical protein